MKWDQEEENPHFDWEEFRKGFSNEGIWKQALQNGNMGKLPWVENYVKELVSKVLPSEQEDAPRKSSKLSSSTFNIFETHNLLIARIQLSKKINPDDLQVFVGSNKIKVLGLTDEEEEKILILPKSVKINGCTAVLKEHVLEIRLPKLTSEPFKEIPIRKV